MSNTIRKYAIFLLIPGVVLAYSVLLKLAAGPYWLATNFDPSYQYFVNGLYLVKGIVPNHTDHPGTPLQMLCCAVCWLFNIGRPASEIVTNGLRAPEFYLNIVFVILSLFSFCTSVGLSVYVFRKTNDPLAAVLSQVPILSFLVLKSWGTFEPILPIVANVSPESLLVGILNLFNICLLMIFFNKPSKNGLFSVLCWGCVCGLGTAVKITFLPLILVPLIILSWKNKILFVFSFAASFFVWTLPILSKYPAVWAWIKGIVTHKGAYGSGGNGIVDISTYLSNWESIMRGEFLFAVFILLAVLMIFWKIVSKAWSRDSFFLLAVSLGILSQFSIVAKHPGAHYLVPGLGLFSALLVLLYLQGPGHNALGRRITFFFIILATLLGSWQAIVYRSKLAGLTREILAFHDQVATKYQNCTAIDYYRSSSQQAALFFGDGWNLSPHLGEELFLLYPDSFYFNVWGNRIFSFNGAVWSNDLLAQSSCVVFRGDGNFDFSNGPYNVLLVEKGRFESIHMLTGTSEKQAAIFLAGAVHFIQAGEYAKAKAWALQARKLHYQPDSSVESIIRLLSNM